MTIYQLFILIIFLAVLAIFLYILLGAWFDCRFKKSDRFYIKITKFSKKNIVLKKARSHYKKGRLKSAIILLLNSYQYEEAVRYLLKFGKIDAAGKILMHIRAYKEAAELYEKHGKWEKAASSYHVLKDFDREKICFQKAQVSIDMKKL